MQMKVVIGIGAVLAAMAVLATDMEHKARTVIFVNATGSAGVLADLAQKPSTVELFDVFGASRGKVNVAEGLVRLPIPTSGYAVVTWERM